MAAAMDLTTEVRKDMVMKSRFLTALMLKSLRSMDYGMSF
jgi:hypothetical protein